MMLLLPALIVIVRLARQVINELADEVDELDYRCRHAAAGARYAGMAHGKPHDAKGMHDHGA